METIPTHLKLLRHLIRPARGGAAGVLVVFALLLYIAAIAGLVGIPLALILISWFFKYAFILFDHTTQGFDEPPALDIQMMNPIDEQRPLAQLVILGLIYLAVKLAEAHLGHAVAAVLAVLFGMLLPASVAELGLEGNILKAAYPVAWLRIVLGLGRLYGLVLLVVAGYALLLGVLANFGLWLPFEILLGMFATLSIFSLLGGVVYERRDHLGLETWVSPERSAALRDKEDARQNDALVTQAYGLMRASNHIKCWQMLNDWLKGRGHTPEDYRWLCERVSPWEDPRYVTRLSQDRIERLLDLKRSGEALDAMAQRFGVDGDFRPKSAAQTLSLARLAAHGGKRVLGKALLQDFAVRFAGDPLIPAAEALSRQMGITP